MVDKAGIGEKLFKKCQHLISILKFINEDFNFVSVFLNWLVIYEIYLCKYISIIHVVCFVELASYLWNLLLKKKYFFFHAYFVEMTSN